jgi:hypothetical protein
MKAKTMIFEGIAHHSRKMNCMHLKEAIIWLGELGLSKLAIKLFFLTRYPVQRPTNSRGSIQFFTRKSPIKSQSFTLE